MPRIAWAAGIAAAYFLLVSPLLTWMEFSDGIENINIETSLEMRRGGPWLVPTYMSEPRVRKPPLLAWITASSISLQTVADMSSPSEAIRESAWKNLAWQVRWPALLAAALTLGLACELGWTLLGKQIGIWGAMIAGTTLLFVEQSRFATTDLQLALWVTLANVCLAKLIFDRQLWFGLIGSGIALGLAFMSKGPVSLLMTVVPALVFALWRRQVLKNAASLTGGIRSSVPTAIVACAIATVLMLTIGLSWFIHAAMNYPSEAHVWWWEIFRTDPSETGTSYWFSYVGYIARFSPWLFLLLVGMWHATEAFWKLTKRRLSDDQIDRALRLVYAGMLIILPIVIMSFFRDRKPRYLYPFAIPGGILAAYSLIQIIHAGRDRIARVVLILHWLMVAGLTIYLPLLGTLGIGRHVRIDGSPWYDRTFGTSITITMVLLLIIGIVLSRKIPSLIVPATACLMILTHWILVQGNRVGRSGDGVSEMLPVARKLWQEHPDVEAYDIMSVKRIPPELAIYLNRPLKRVSEISGIPQANAPQVYVAIQRKNGLEPQPPPGWRLYMKTPRDLDWWVVFMRESRPL